MPKILDSAPIFTRTCGTGFGYVSAMPLRDALQDNASQRATFKRRAAAARAQAAAVRTWMATATAAAAGTMWRVTSAWVEEVDGTRCAELTHVSSGKVRTIRLDPNDTPEICRARIGETK